MDDKRCTLIIPVYVDDLFPIGDKVLTNKFKAWLPSYFNITPPVNTHFFLGVRLIRGRNWRVFEDGTSNYYIALDQNMFVDSVLEQLTVTLKDFDSPMALMSNLLPNPDPKENTDPAIIQLYQSAIGSLMYIMLSTQPDLAFAVQKLSSFSSNPSADHCRAIACVFGYLNKTQHTSLIYYLNSNPISKKPVGFCDADWANRKGREDKRHSISGNVFFFQAGPFLWSSKKQELTTESTTKAEYISLWLARRQSTWIRKILEAIGFPLEKPLCIMSDLQSAIALVTWGEAAHKGSKHFNVKFHAT